jgi:outer membrane autotransporter protein
VQPTDGSVAGGRRRTRPAVRLLLATSSVAALIVGAAPRPAQAACYTGPFPFTNTAAQSCINVTNTSFSGNLVNSGTGVVSPGGPDGITVDNSTITGQVSNAGTISVGGNGILVQNNSLVTNGIVNSGSITAGSGARGIVVTGVSAFAGGILNSGTISAGFDGIFVGNLASFAGGITNSGSITAGSSGIGIFVVNVSAFSGGIANSGTITAGSSGNGIAVVGVSTFSGGIANSGTITAGTSGNGIAVSGVSTFSGGITNSGTITVAGTGGNGIFVQGVQTFSGGITNSGTITAGSAGISVQFVGAFSGDIVNTGTITAAVGIDICGCVTSFAGNIVNTGTINATGTGIFVGAVPTFLGSIVNTGTITAGIGIFVIGVDSFAGGILNSGSLNGSNGIGVGSISAFAGGITNTGNIAVTFTGIRVNVVSTFAGGIVNSGTITTTTTFGAGIAVQSVDSFFGGITNTGSISAAGVGILVNTGCCATSITTFAGGIFNSGTITAGNTGIFVTLVSTFGGGITNTGVISGTTGILITSDVTGMSIFNSGTITGTAGTAIQFGGGVNTLTLGPGFAINGLVIGSGADAFQLGGSSGSGTFDVTTIGPQYQGFASFAKVDNATWTLTGVNNGVLPWTVQQGTLNVAAGAALPSSPFAVQGGILSVDGTVGAVTVNGGVLMGNGTLGGLTVNGGGTVAPGHSIGQLNVNGPVSFTTGSFYQVEANAAGQSDKIVATGAASLTGGTVQALPQTGNYALSTTYTILTANGGRNGAFSGVTSSVPFLIASLSYDANDAFLTLTRNTRFFQNQAGTSNQQAVASALDTFPTNNALFLAAANLTGGATRQALDLLSGEIHASVQSVMLDDSLFARQAILGRLRQASFERGGGPASALGAGGPLAYADATGRDALAYAASARDFPIKAPRVALPGPERTWWAQGVGAWGKINGDGNAAEVNRNLGGVFTGFDQRFGDWVVGIAGGYTSSSVSVSARASSANIDAAHLAAYAGTSFGQWNVRSGAAFTWHAIDTSRVIGFPGFFDQTTARYRAGQGQVFGEIGYGMAFRGIAVEPFAGMAYVHLDSTSFAETGGLAALAGGAGKEDIGYSTLGVRAATTYLLPDGKVLVPRASLAWQHTFGALTPTANLAFQSAGIPFTVAGAPIARDAALVDGGFDLRVTAQATFGVSYLGQLANTAQDHSVKGNFSWKF